MTKLKKISSNLSNLPADIRTEVLLSQCIEGGLLQKEFTVQTDGFFYRCYADDMYKFNLNEQDSHKKFLEIHLSRPGLYDTLPEGLFFQPPVNSKNAKTAAEMAEECRINKKKETEIRKFFAPFENEFFLHSLKNETTETDLLSGLRSGWLKEYFIDFWKLPPDIPANAALVLVMFLPYVHRIAGNIEATAGVLQKIINEPVKADLIYYNDNDAGTGNNILGSYTLGSHLTCGESFTEQYPAVSITIGPLQKTKAYQYTVGGNYFSLLQTFYNFFVPAYAEVITTILLKKGADKFILKKKEDTPLLGISTVL